MRKRGTQRYRCVDCDTPVYIVPAKTNYCELCGKRTAHRPDSVKAADDSMTEVEKSNARKYGYEL